MGLADITLVTGASKSSPARAALRMPPSATVPSTRRSSPTTTPKPTPFSRRRKAAAATVSLGPSRNPASSGMGRLRHAAVARQLEDPRRQLVGRMRAGHAPGGGAHRCQGGGVVEEAVDERTEALGRGLVVANKHRGAGFDQGGGVHGLVVMGRVRVGDENGGQAG